MAAKKTTKAVDERPSQRVRSSDGLSTDMFTLEYACEAPFRDCVSEICDAVEAAYNRLRAEFEIPQWKAEDYARFPLFLTIATNENLMVGERTKVAEYMDRRGYNNLIVKYEKS